MSMLRASIAFAALVAASLPAAAEPTQLLQQTQCSTTGVCTSFSSATAFPITARAFSIFVPAAGRVQWTFTGSAQCENTSNLSSFGAGVIDVNTEIMTNAVAAPSVANPSANRFAFRLPPATAAGVTYSMPLNFSATRTLAYSSGGLKTVFFRVGRNRVDLGARCNILTGAFSAVYAPN